MTQRPTISALREALRANDPLPAQVWRGIKVALQSGAVEAVDPKTTPRTLALMIRRGLTAAVAPALHAILTPDRLAFVDEERRFTWAQANDAISQRGNGLTRVMGVGAREPVLIMSENRAEYPIVWFGLLRLGARTVHASYRLTAPELSYLVEHSRARVLVVSPKCAAAAHEVAEKFDARVLEMGAPLDTLLAQSASTWPARAEKGAGDNIVYTSGTTGRPKGTVRDLSSVGLAELLRILEGMPLKMGDKHLITSPLYHSAGQVFTLIQTSLGATIYLQSRFEAQAALRLLSEERINSTFMVPTMLRDVLALDDAVLRRFRTPELRAIVSGAAEFPHPLRERAVAHFGAKTIYDFYGSTETGWVTLVRGDEMMARPSSVGRALPGQTIAIRNEAGEAVPVGTVGTVHIRSAQAMTGYLRDKRATAETIDGGGWVTVDDLGRLDDDGYLYLAGRARDMVISGGVNIYPIEIEAALERHPQLVECAVLGLPDERWGERLVCIAVVSGDLDAASLEDFARQQLAGYKVPKQWLFREELPKNPTGKVLKRVLRDELARRA